MDLPRHPFRSLLFAVIWASLAACTGQAWNNPYPAHEEGKNILYSSFTERPKHLDPAQSYVENEFAIIAQIYEPPLQYHYLKRPYTLIPLAAQEMPRAVYLDQRGEILPETAAAQDIAFSIYDIRIKPGIRYEPHPAFARDAAGKYRYQQLSRSELADIDTLQDFKHRDSRDLAADDYVYQIKRLAHPGIHSPIFGLMSEYIVGLKEYGELLSKAAKEPDNQPYLDLTRYPLEGATALDRYTYRIKVRGKYPQLLYWLAMPFFAPVPPEADRFYSQPGLIEKNITLDWYPVGTGAYRLTVNDPNRQMILERNPNFHGEAYPVEGEPEDQARGLLEDTGKPLPFIDKVVYSLEKESIPYWNKFLQGYYDASGISSDSFDQAVRISTGGDVAVTEGMQEKGIRLLTSVGTDLSYMGFNMLDPVVGGLSERARKLRQAISIAVDYEEFISIFLNGRGIPAQGPIPPGIFGYVEGETGVNSYVYDWVNGRPQRKSLEEARRLLAEAGYPNGRDAQTGKPLLLHFDTALRGPDDKAYLDWLRKQFQKLDLQLDIRNTDFNRFQEKMLKGNAQLWQWGWNADYPDPENFMFLLYGPNAKVGKNGENAANYDNTEFNKLFEQMKNMDNGPQRQAIIVKMMDIARNDAPLLWGLHRKKFGLYHSWYENAKPNEMANNELKYIRIDAGLRSKQRAEWNKPVLTPLFGIVVILLIGILPAMLSYLCRARRTNAASAGMRRSGRKERSPAL